jgi:hypothetical protein
VTAAPWPGVVVASVLLALAALAGCAGPAAESRARPDADAAAESGQSAPEARADSDREGGENVGTPAGPESGHRGGEPERDPDAEEIAAASEEESVPAVAQPRSPSGDASGAGAEDETAASEEARAPGAARPHSLSGGAGGLKAGSGAAELAALPPVPKQDPQTLMDLDRPGITLLLGAPGLVRRDAPAEVWQYSGADCVLDLFLYGPGAARGGGGDERRAEGSGAADAGYRVVYYEMRSRGTGEVNESDCLTGLVAAQRRREAG